MKTVTIKDIAKKLNISTAAVSMALNGRKGVSKALRKKILETAEQMEYVVNDSARFLSSGQSHKVGLFILRRNANQEENIGHDVSSIIIQRLIQALPQYGYTPICWAMDRYVKPENININMQKEKLCAAVILGIDPLDEHIHHLKTATQCPIILFDYEAQNMSSCVGSNNRQAMQMLLAYIQRMKRRKLVVLSPESQAQISRIRNNILRQLNITDFPDIDIHFISTQGFTEEDGQKAANYLLASSIVFDTVFCHSDEIAAGVLDILERSKIDVPEDVSVIGFDNIHAARYMGKSGLTSMQQDYTAISEEICKLIKQQKHNQKIYTNVELIIRSTSCIKSDSLNA